MRFYALILLLGVFGLAEAPTGAMAAQNEETCANDLRFRLQKPWSFFERVAEAPFLFVNKKRKDHDQIHDQVDAMLTSLSRESRALQVSVLHSRRDQTPLTRAEKKRIAEIQKQFSELNEPEVLWAAIEGGLSSKVPVAEMLRRTVLILGVPGDDLSMNSRLAMITGSLSQRNFDPVRLAERARALILALRPLPSPLITAALAGGLPSMNTPLKIKEYVLAAAELYHQDLFDQDEQIGRVFAIIRGGLRYSIPVEEAKEYILDVDDLLEKN